MAGFRKSRISAPDLPRVPGRKLRKINPETFDNPVMFQVFGNDLFHIFQAHPAVKHTFGIDDDTRALLTGVQTPGFLCPDPNGQSPVPDQLLEGSDQRVPVVMAAADPRARRPLIGANEYMLPVIHN